MSGVSLACYEEVNDKLRICYEKVTRKLFPLSLAFLPTSKQKVRYRFLHGESGAARQRTEPYGTVRRCTVPCRPRRIRCERTSTSPFGPHQLSTNRYE